MYAEQDEDTFASVAWDRDAPSNATSTRPAPTGDPSAGGGAGYSVDDDNQSGAAGAEAGTSRFGGGAEHGAGGEAGTSSAAGTGSPVVTRRRSTGGTEMPTPQWEGYLIVEVRNPVRELEGTKDSFVSYQVTAKVGFPLELLGRRELTLFSLVDGHGDLRVPHAVFASTVPGLCLSARPPDKGLSRRHHPAPP